MCLTQDKISFTSHSLDRLQEHGIILSNQSYNKVKKIVFNLVCRSKEYIAPNESTIYYMLKKQEFRFNKNGVLITHVKYQ